MEELSHDEMMTRLREGETLEVDTGGGVYEVWAEVFASPPTLYYEGEPHPLDQMDRILRELIAQVEAGEIEARWIEDDD
jgi:hypothetical protein